MLDELLKALRKNVIAWVFAMLGTAVMATPFSSFLDLDNFALSLAGDEQHIIVTPHRYLQGVVVEAHGCAGCATWMVTDSSGIEVKLRKELSDPNCIWGTLKDTTEVKSFGLPAGGTLTITASPATACRIYLSSADAKGLPRRALDDLRFQVRLAEAGGAALIALGLLYFVAAEVWRRRVRKRERDSDTLTLRSVLLAAARTWRLQLFPDITGNEAAAVDHGAVHAFKAEAAAAVKDPTDGQTLMKACVEKSYATVFPLPKPPRGCFPSAGRPS